MVHVPLMIHLSRWTGRLRRTYYGWWMVAASVVLLTYHSGAWWHGFGVLVTPMSEEFGWSRASIAGAFSLTNLEGGFLGLFSGWLIDRYGPRVVVVGGVILVTLGYVSLSQVDSLAGFYLTYGLLMGLGAHASGVPTHVAAAARWFVRRRAQAIGLVTLGGGFGGVLVTPVVAILVEAYGWRAAALVVGAGFLLVGLPVAALIRPGRPEAYGLQPDGDIRQTAGSAIPGTMAKEGERDSGVSEAVRTRSFWLMALAWGLSGAYTSSMAVHLVPLLIARGIPPTLAASAVPVQAIMTVPSRLIFPWFADRYEIRSAYAVSCLLLAAGVLTLLVAPNLGVAYVAMAVFGFGQGGNVPLRPAMTASYFGRQRFGTIHGFMGSLASVVTMLVPVAIGAIYDATGSYAPGLLLLSACGLLAAAVVVVARRPDLPPGPVSEQVASRGERAAATSGSPAGDRPA